MSFNARGLANRLKRQQVFNWIKQKRVKIALLQETHSTADTEYLWRFDWGGDIIFSHGNSAARGTAILFDKDTPVQILNSYTDPEGRFIILDLELNGLRLTLSNVYAPNEDSPDFFIDFIQKIEAVPNDNRIIGGDFNLVLDINVDKKGGLKTTHVKSRDAITAWMESTDLTDIWRMQHPNDLKYTWYRYNPTKIFCRLDYFLVSFGLVEKVVSTRMSPGFRSDHSAVHLDFIPFMNSKGRGFWKLNCSLLYDLNYVMHIKEVIRTTADLNQAANPNLLWDTIKMAVRGESIKLGSQKKKEINHNIESIENEIIRLQEQLNCTEQDSILEQIEAKREELQNIIKLKTQGAIIRSRIQYYDEGEKNSKYFFNLEKRNANIKSINRLQLHDNEITENPKLIMAEMENFYKKLYSSVETSDPNEFTCRYIPPVNIKREHYIQMELPLSENEILKIVKSLKKNKTPGEDGLPSEFYQVFWTDIKHYLINSFQYSYEVGELSITQKRGILSLIPKKSDPLRLKNWRPISLLNQDYKILAKLVAERIKLSLPYLIDTDQNGFIKGRFIGQNITSLVDILQFVEDNDISALLISIDYEKAFDKLEWSFIEHSLHYFNFPNVIIKWVNILYTNIQSCVSNNGHHSPYFTLQRGVRQGCPLSPYLFIIAAEILSINIRQNPKILGVKIGDKLHKIKQYADDTQLITLFDAGSVTEIVLTFQEFTTISGLTINYDKTEILRIGNIKNSLSTLQTGQNFKWTNDNVNILGIIFTTTLSDFPSANINPIMVKMNNLSKIWGKRKLTLFGKRTIIDTLLVSQLIYRLSVIPTPDLHCMKQIDGILFNFLWDNKPHKIAKSLVCNTYNNAGLKMVDIYHKDKSLKIGWIQRLATNPPHSISPIVDAYCKVPVNFLLKCNIAPTDISFCFIRKLPTFWSDVFRYWCQYNYKKPTEIKNVRDEIIWFNSNIKVGNILLFNSGMFEKGIITINDIVRQDGSFYAIQDIMVRYNCNANFIYLFGIVSAIKSAYNIKDTSAGREPSYTIDTMISKSKVPKFVYNTLRSQNVVFPEKAYQHFNRIFSTSLSKDLYIGAFELLYKSTVSTKLRDFQFRLLHNALITNVHLHKWGLRENDTCTLCGSHPETYVHLFIQCNQSNYLWEYIYDVISHVSSTYVRLDNKEIILGVIDKPCSNFYNHISMLIKQYIYACRCLNKKPNRQVIIEKIKDAKNVELIIARQTDKLGIYTDKWELLSTL